MEKIDELRNIEIAIELDKGRSLKDVAESFHVSTDYVRKLAIIAGLATSVPRKKTRTPLTPEEKEILFESILEGEDLELLAAQYEVSSQHIRSLCRQNNISIPRSYHQLNTEERQEIKALSEDHSTQEVAEAYHVTLSTVEKLAEAEYKRLNLRTLGILYEILSANPEASPRFLLKLAEQQELDVNLEDISSYQKRLRTLGKL
ncbi:hypothetical protein WDW89_15530 [Deltaproteobacteria bacterium TL4]